MKLNRYEAVDMPEYARLGKGFVYMRKEDSPYEDAKDKKGIVRIGHADEETGRLIPDSWGYYWYVDRNAPGRSDFEWRISLESRDTSSAEEDISSGRYSGKYEEKEKEKSRDLYSLGYSMAVEEFFEQTRLNAALEAVFDEEDRVMIRYLAALYHMYGPGTLDCEGIVSECLPRGFLPVMTKSRTVELCMRISEKREEFFDEWERVLESPVLTAVPAIVTMKIIQSERLGWEYRWDAYFSENGVVWYRKYALLIDNNSGFPVRFIPEKDDEYEFRNDRMLNEAVADEKYGACNILIKESDIWQTDDIPFDKSRKLTVSLRLNKDYIKELSRYSKEGKTGWSTEYPGNEYAVTEYEWNGMRGKLLIGLSMDNRNVILADLHDRLKPKTRIKETRND